MGSYPLFYIIGSAVDHPGPGPLVSWHLMLAWRARKIWSAIVWPPVWSTGRRGSSGTPRRRLAAKIASAMLGPLATIATTLSRRCNLRMIVFITLDPLSRLRHPRSWPTAAGRPFNLLSKCLRPNGVYKDDLPYLRLVHWHRLLFQSP